MNPVRPPLWLISLALMTAAFSVIDVKASVAADAETDIAGNHDTERLDCLEAIANPLGDQAPAKATDSSSAPIASTESSWGGGRRAINVEPSGYTAIGRCCNGH